MLTPGSNTLNLALSVLGKTTVQYYKYADRQLNDEGLWETTYKKPKSLIGSVQAIPRNRYENLGLDFQKSYINFFVSKNLLDLERDVSGDKLIWNGKQWQCMSATDWFSIDGWLQMLCVAIGPEDCQNAI